MTRRAPVAAVIVTGFVPPLVVMDAMAMLMMAPFDLVVVVPVAATCGGWWRGHQQDRAEKSSGAREP